MLDLGKIIKEEAYRLVLDECTQYLFERWSHSDEIDSSVELIYKTIEETVADAEKTVIDSKALYVLQNSVCIELFGMDILLTYHMFVGNSYDVINFLVGNSAGENNFSEDTNELVVTIYTIDGNLVESVSNPNLYHEVEHVSQISKGKERNANYKEFMDNAYKIASSIISDAGKYSEAEEKVAWLYYYSNPHEQDAFVNEYYYNLSHMKEFLIGETNPTRKILKEYEKLVGWYDENKNGEDVVEAVLEYRKTGMPKKNFEAMIHKGLKRFKKKMANVEKHFKYKVGKLSENSIHSGIRAETGSLIRFRCPEYLMKYIW